MNWAGWALTIYLVALFGAKMYALGKTDKREGAMIPVIVGVLLYFAGFWG